MTQNIKKLPSCRLHLCTSFIVHSYLLSFTTWGGQLGTHAFTSTYIPRRFKHYFLYFRRFLYSSPFALALFFVIIFLHHLSICWTSHFLLRNVSRLPSFWRESVCMKMTLRFRSHARWPKPNLPSSDNACGSCMCLSVGVWTCLDWFYKMRVDGHTPLKHSRESQAHTLWVQPNLSWLSEASGLLNKLWAAVWWHSTGLSPR